MQTSAVSLQIFPKLSAAEGQAESEGEDTTLSGDLAADDPTLLPVPIALA